MAKNFTELAFTDQVRKVQERYGTRMPYERMESKENFRTHLTWQEKEFIQKRDGFYIASVAENGWPYMQYRGGPTGFFKIVDDSTLAFADFRGNGQYITTGNFEATNKTVLFLMDYANKQRLKIWAETEVLHASEHPEMAENFTMPDYDSIVERIFIFKVQAFDWNCPQHITQRYSVKEIRDTFPQFDLSNA